MDNGFLSLPFSLSFEINFILLIISALIVFVVCLKLAFSYSLVESVILLSIFSLFISICYLLMDAPDVAMTEVALGACLSSCVFLNLIKSLKEEQITINKKRIILASILCFMFISVLTYASLDLPDFGSDDSPLQTHISAYYIKNTWKDLGIPSMVAAILASYRGYDTLGETTVILIAGLAVMVILSRRKDKSA